MRMLGKTLLVLFLMLIVRALVKPGWALNSEVGIPTDGTSVSSFGVFSSSGVFISGNQGYSLPPLSSKVKHGKSKSSRSNIRSTINNKRRRKVVEIPKVQAQEEISLLQDEQDDRASSTTSSTTTTKSMNNETTMKTKEMTIMMMDMDQIMNDMGVWSFQQDVAEQQNSYGDNRQRQPLLQTSSSLHTLRDRDDDDDEVGESSTSTGAGNDDITSGHFTSDRSWSYVKIIPDEHHVSAFLNKGVVKRFLFLNDKMNNPLSITITPCTSILLWHVRFWPIMETGIQEPEHIKTYRTQRTVSFQEEKARRGVYSIDIRAINWDSYVHLYATSFNSEPIREYYDGHGNKSPLYTERRDKFYQHMFSQVDETEWSSTPASESDGISSSLKYIHPLSSDNGLNIPDDGGQVNTNLNMEFNKRQLQSNKPRIWVQRLRGNRLHVKWDTSPVNPHLMTYCIVVNTKRDYSSLCSASGERFGVLPPDLLHVTYYGSQSNLIMLDNNKNNTLSSGKEKYERQLDSPRRTRHSHKGQGHRHRHRHGQGSTRPRRNNGSNKAAKGNEDIVIGCLNKKTNYILNNLHPGRLYYFNVFLRDSSTNVSYPYVRTTLKYHAPNYAPNALKDAKPTKVKLTSDNLNTKEKAGENLILKPTTLKFNLNKPCSDLTAYVMPCGGGSIVYETFLGNVSIYKSGVVDTLDIMKLQMPKRGKYFIKISQNFQKNNSKDWNNRARMVEVFVGKKNKRFPLPRLPAIPKLTEDESKRTCDSVTIQWWPSPDPRDNEYCIFLKEENRKRIFQFKKPNQCDVERSLKTDPYVTHSLCLQRSLTPETMLLHQNIVGLQSNTTYVIQLILRRHNGKSLSYDLHAVRTASKCGESD